MMLWLGQKIYLQTQNHQCFFEVISWEILLSLSIVFDELQGIKN